MCVGRVCQSSVTWVNCFFVELLMRFFFMGWLDSPEKNLLICCSEVEAWQVAVWLPSGERRLRNASENLIQLWLSHLSLVFQSRDSWFYPVQGINLQFSSVLRHCKLPSCADSGRGWWNISDCDSYFESHLYPTFCVDQSWAFCGFCDVSVIDSHFPHW